MRISDWSADVCSSDLAPQHEVNLLPRPEEGEARLEGRPQGSGLSSSTLPAAASSHFVNDAALAFALRRSGGTTMAIDGTLAGDGNLIAAHRAQSRANGGGGLAVLLKSAQARSGRSPMSMVAEYWKLHRKPGRLTPPEYFDYNLSADRIYDAAATERFKIGRASGRERVWQYV